MAKCNVCGKRIDPSLQRYYVTDSAQREHDVCESCVLAAIQSGSVLQYDSSSGKVVFTGGEAAPIPAEQCDTKKKSRTGLIVSAIVLCVLLLAAVLFFAGRKNLPADSGVVVHVPSSFGTLPEAESELPAEEPQPAPQEAPSEELQPAPQEEPSEEPQPAPQEEPSEDPQPTSAAAALRRHIIENGEVTDDGAFIIGGIGIYDGFDYFLMAEDGAEGMLSVILQWPETEHFVLLSLFTDSSGAELEIIGYLIDYPAGTEMANGKAVTVTGMLDPYSHTVGAMILPDTISAFEEDEAFDPDPGWENAFGDTVTTFVNLAIEALGYYAEDNLYEGFMADLGFTAYSPFLLNR